MTRRDSAPDQEFVPRVSATATVVEAAVYLNVSEGTIRRLVLERRIPFCKVGRLVRIRWADLDALLAASTIERLR